MSKEDSTPFKPSDDLQKVWRLGNLIDQVSDPVAMRTLAYMAQREIHLAYEVVPSGYVYVLKAGPYYKIGLTKYLDTRIKTLRVQLPWPVEVVAAYPCLDHFKAESQLHQEFSKYRENGEWFCLDYEAHRYLTEDIKCFYLFDDSWSDHECIEVGSAEACLFPSTLVRESPVWNKMFKRCLEIVE